jgi:hypothetical protein
VRILDLFSGTGSATQAFKDLGHEVIKVEIDDYFEADYRDVMELDGLSLNGIDFIWASPPCTTFSVASIGHYWKMVDGLAVPKDERAKKALELVQKTIEIITTINPTYGFVIENPRGMLRKMTLMSGLERRTVTYCQYGDTRMKPTDLWGTVVGWTSRPACKNGSSCHEAASRGSRTGTQGLANSKIRSKVPYELGLEICQAIERHAV